MTHDMLHVPGFDRSLGKYVPKAEYDKVVADNVRLREACEVARTAFGFASAKSRMGNEILVEASSKVRAALADTEGEACEICSHPKHSSRCEVVDETAPSGCVCEFVGGE